MSRIAIDRLRELFEYSPLSGEFTRKKSISHCRAGDVATGTISHGYVVMSVDNKLVAAHRIAWALATGEFPKGDIDHIDGNRKNNALANLRDVSRSVNLENQRCARSNNKSTGVLGVYASRNGQKFDARIESRGKVMRLGRFDSIDLARSAYLSAKRELHQGCTI